MGTSSTTIDNTASDLRTTIADRAPVQRNYDRLTIELCHHLEQAQVLRKREDSLIARIHAPTESPGTAIVKLWTRPGITGWIRRVSGTSSSQREFRALTRLHSSGVSVPRVLAHLRLNETEIAYTDALVLEDIGSSVTALQHIKLLIAEGREEALRTIEDTIIDMTCGLVRAGIVDPDHSLNNLAVTPTGRVVGLDFELALCTRFPSLMPRKYGQMLGRLLSSYTFAVQPDVSRASAFADRLLKHLRPPQSVLRAGKRALAQHLDIQRSHTGIDIHLDAHWRLECRRGLLAP